MTHEFREQSKPPDVESGTKADGGGCPPTDAQRSHEPRRGDPPMETAEAAHPFGERSAKRKSGNHGKRPMTITVVVIPVEAYPAFAKDPEHAFASLSEAERIQEIDDFCGRLLCQSWQRRRAPAITRKAA